MAASAGVQAGAAAVQARGAGVSTLRGVAMLCGAAGWLFIGLWFWNGADRGSFHLLEWTYVLPPLAWVLPSAALLLRGGRVPQALGILTLYPLALLANSMALMLAETLWPVGPGLADINAVRQIVLAIILCAGWFELAQARYQWMGEPPVTETAGDALRGLRKSIGVLELLVVMVFVVVAASIFLPIHGDGYSVRSRVSELILAGSSAKTALSEGMQTYGSWSPEWMSAITISATGMISSAHIGPAGVITIYGTAPTSGSVVTMTPTITTDNRLVWSCTGSPARYMPASCR
jgi:type IV pilus assembly protein PilA